MLHPLCCRLTATVCQKCATLKEDLCVCVCIHTSLNLLGSTSVLCPQARLEVHRFGITGYGKGTERVLERERAIMLGAKVRGCY